MPNAIFQKQWPLAWTASDDAVGGRREGLVRMDNLTIDEVGAISLATGTRKLEDAPASVHSIYSKNFGGNKKRFYGAGGSVYVNGEELVTGGGEVAYFSSALGYVLIATGDKKKKYNGTDAFQLGLERPSKPLIKAITNPNVSFANPDEDMSVLQGEEFIDPLFPTIKQIRSDATGIRALLGDTNNPNVIDGQPGTSTDQFWHRTFVSDTAILVKMRIVVVLGGEGDDDIDTAENYFWKEFSNTDSPSIFNQGLNTWTTLTCLRSDFERAGSDNTKTWDDCIGVRLEVVTNGELIIAPGHFAFFGGGKSTIDGKYTYIQVNVNNSSYKGRSAASEQTDVIEAFQGVIEVTPAPPDDDQVNEVWIYRRSAEPSADITRIGEPRRLDRFYRIKVLTLEDGFGAFRDEVQDKDALFEGEIVAQDLASVKDIDEEFIGFSGLVRSRIGYLTAKHVFISAVADLDSYNPRHTVVLSGSDSEINLFITSTVDAMLIGTTEDIYEISGTFAELSDGSLDVAVRPLGLSTAAPITRSFYNHGGNIFYFASDGWRRLTSGTSSRIVGNLNLLFRGQNRHGLPPVAIFPKGTGVYPVAVYNEQLWAFTNLVGGQRVGLIYDFQSDTWTCRLLAPTSCFIEEDGTFIAGVGNAIKQFDYDTTIDGGTQTVQLITPHYDGDMPRNRKDLFTLKILGDSGGASMSIMINPDNTGWINCGQFALGGAGSELILDLHTRKAIAKRLAVQIVGAASRFKLWALTVEFGARPEQLTYLRIENTNLNTLARKRFTSFAFVIDTLGNPVIFTPYLDNDARATSTVIKTEKLTHPHYFDTETIGVDIGGTLQSVDGAPFEFYGVNLEETVSEKLPTPTTFLVIPANDYGNPNRKRHSSYKFQINTRGENVVFTPILDGVELDPEVFNTESKRTVEYFFPDDTIGIDLGGKIASEGDTPFEFYGVIIPQDLEVLPPRLMEKFIKQTNLGIAAKKRIRTIPMMLNTNGFDVSFVPIFDGVPGEMAVFNTPTRKTVLWYATEDVFCIDIAGELKGTFGPFEFDGLLKPEDVEVLPVGKKFDQVGPIQYDKTGKLLRFRVRALFGESIIPYIIYTDDRNRYNGTFEVIPGRDSVWEVKQLPATISGCVYRIEIGPTQEVFHRWSVEMLVNELGMESGAKWRKLS